MCTKNKLKNWLTKLLYKDVYHNYLIIFIILFFWRPLFQILFILHVKFLQIMNVKKNKKNFEDF